MLKNNYELRKIKNRKKIDEALHYVSKKILESGKKALLIKCADLIDNIDYIVLVEDKHERNELLKKHKMLIEMSSEYIGNEEIYKLLEIKIKDIENKKRYLKKYLIFLISYFF